MEDEPLLEDDADNEEAIDAEELRLLANDGDGLAQWALDVGAGMKGEVGYPTPEDAALAEWEDHPEVAARVISFEYRDVSNAVVVTDTVPSHPMWNYSACGRPKAGSSPTTTPSRCRPDQVEPPARRSGIAGRRGRQFPWRATQMSPS